VTICGIDKRAIEIEGNEIPLVTNGSCRAFVDELKRAGVAVLDEVRTAYELKEPFAVVGDGDRPDSCLAGVSRPELEVSYLFQCPNFRGCCRPLANVARPGRASANHRCPNLSVGA
jgi:UDP-3-O-acyl-N-acetylglucosamine deacetylase